ncbi:leukocyte cell-derived chemotaxin-2-like isoform X1 [Carassius gibelio]|uniref:leukocyte cell-derived chemotaxin-2-like isoform X1 n=1 Tax=Carassius gibelio TaxID=101364 RepID=UPI0022795CA4|nr:leukocyte cell-derived chemotaxin-2-like isoform X1 [Carassius gibelio]
MLLKLSLTLLFLACLFPVGICFENDKKTTKRKVQEEEMKIAQPDERLTAIAKGREIVIWSREAKPRNDMGCTSIGGICQSNIYICQGRYLKDKCRGEKSRQCCTPAAAWSALCAGSHHNRVRACDSFGCGGFNSRSDDRIHKGIHIVCGDYGIINAPFSGNLGGPVGRAVGDSVQYDGVKLYSKVHCVKIFNIRPYVYFGSVVQGEAMGYLLPLQERFSGITSHLELQMCDGSDPSPFI